MKAIMFDLDGTLIDSMPVWQSMDKIYLESKGYKYEKIVTEKLKAVSVGETSKVLDEIYGTEGEFIDIWDFVYDKMETQYRENFNFKPHVFEKIKELKSKGIKMCITTASTWNLIKGFMERNKVLEYMDFVLTPDLAGYEKDSDEYFTLALEKLGVEKSECFLVDDAYYALKRADKLGIGTIGVEDRQALEERENVKKIAQVYLKDIRELDI